MKKIGMIVLTVAILFCALPIVPTTAAASEIDADADWYDEGVSVFEVETAEQLYGMLYLISIGKTFSGKTVRLMKDITVNTQCISELTESERADLIPWQEPGKGAFNGTLDGNGKTISGIYHETTASSVGLFGEMSGNTATIQNLSIVNSMIVSGGSYVAGLYGYVKVTQGLTLRDLYIDVDIRSTATAPDSVGGLIGYQRGNGTVTLERCVFVGDIVLAGNATSGVGGLVARGNQSLTLTDCAMYGAITAESATMGGLVGSAYSALTVSNSIVAATFAADTVETNAFYGSAGSPTLTNCLYTEDADRAYPGAPESISGSYRAVTGENLWGSAAMFPLSVYDFVGWRAVKNDFPLPESLYSLYTVQTPTVEEDPMETGTRLVGYQVSELSEEGTFSIRLVAVVDSISYSSVGFCVDATGEKISPKSKEHTSQTVYYKLLGVVSDGTTVDYTAKDLGGAYIFALNINGISAKSGEIQFSVSTFCVGSKGRIDSEKTVFTVDCSLMA